MTGSPKTPPHSPTDRFEVIRIDPLSYLRDTSWKNRCAALAYEAAQRSRKRHTAR
jgi:hypothetical protein